MAGGEPMIPPMDAAPARAPIHNEIRELAEHLEPTMRLDVRRLALEIALALSTPLDGSAEQAFSHDNFVLGRAICVLCEATRADRARTLSALTNFCSISSTCANFIVNHAPTVVRIAYQGAATAADYGDFAARLLANLSRFFAGETHELLTSEDPNYLSTVVERVATSSDDGIPTLLGYAVINLATVSRVRRGLATRSGADNLSLLHKLYAVIAQTEDEERRRIVIDVLRNCAFEDSIHPLLLDDSDDFLVAVLMPLADASDALDEEETGKLPLRLQYWEGTRSTDAELRNKAVEALFQLCATRHGRNVLRAKGVYPLMRELDKATEGETPEVPRVNNTHRLIGHQEHTLHALIGILIRYEDEMGVDPTLHSIREVGD